MNSGVKLILYVVLVIAVLVTGVFFFKNFGKLFARRRRSTQIQSPTRTPPP
jgi:hypothetical protein